MRKILLIILIVLLLVFGYVTVTKGIDIASLHISSVMQIDETSKELDEKTEELNSLIDISYPSKIEELKNASNRMQEAKQKYLDETNLSSDEEIQSALQIENYDIERLWTKVGNHANKEGVNLKLVLSSSSSGSSETKDLSFTVEGSYIAITNFVYDLEDDDELNFRIYNFKILPYQGDILQATFLVKDIRITKNSLNDSLSSSSQAGTTTDTNDTLNTKQ